MNDADTIISNLRFNLMATDFKTTSFGKVNEGDCLVVLKDLALTLNDLAPITNDNFQFLNNLLQQRISDTAADCATVVWVADVSNTASWRSPYHHMVAKEQAKEELIETGKINGFEVLNLRSLEKLWLSHYDMENLTKKP